MIWPWQLVLIVVDRIWYRLVWRRRNRAQYREAYGTRWRM